MYMINLIVDLTNLRKEEREALREREKVEEMLFHEIIFDLMMGLENKQVLGGNNEQSISKDTVTNVLRVCVRDGTDYENNLREYSNMFQVVKGNAEYQRIEFVCKYILKKSLRQKSNKSINQLRPVTKSKEQLIDRENPTV